MITCLFVNIITSGIKNWKGKTALFQDNKSMFPYRYTGLVVNLGQNSCTCLKYKTQKQMAHHSVHGLLLLSSHLLLPSLVLSFHLSHLGTKLLDSKGTEGNQIAFKSIFGSPLRLAMIKRGFFKNKHNSSHTNLDLPNFHQCNSQVNQTTFQEYRISSYLEAHSLVRGKDRRVLQAKLPTLEWIAIQRK